ncbi:hypothetical protein CANMA_004034 [Candida margitis]|uniref:uncharacterized protein n=1 Tax=Candida margitis TaxID=1775924 RepID=UPI002225FE06|nr:uncharacterized protein CANMA_004034 [Candida margitis]KAI5960254.1 hypothetical protein CANMA_004034 [Candida margitis]
MTQEPSVDIANTYQQINEAEKQALKLESMLDSFEAKLDSILKDAENITKSEENGSGECTSTVQASSRDTASEEKKESSDSASTVQVQEGN